MTPRKVMTDTSAHSHQRPGEQRKLQFVTSFALLFCLVSRPLSTACNYNYFIWQQEDALESQHIIQHVEPVSSHPSGTLVLVQNVGPTRLDLFAKNDSIHSLHVGTGGIKNVAVVQTTPSIVSPDSGEYCDKTDAEIVEGRTKCASKNAKVPRLCATRCAGEDEDFRPLQFKYTAWCARFCDVSCRIIFCPNFYVAPRLPMPPVAEVRVHRPEPSTVDRLIPRIVHQTWREPISKEKYPNWSEFQASFQQEGYEYRFYTDSEARGILETHFPPEIVSAYDDLLPGAFKADLFRYCILLLYGGVYADIDILMTSKLDDVIQDDTGFLIPLDKQPFSSENKTLCLWNGFMAVSPGHPYMAKVVENVVNAVRNRYTYVDYAKMVTCPYQANEREMNKWAFLFATGPCMLGLTVNQVLGRHEQTTFVLGELPGNADIPGKSVFMDTVRNKVRRFMI